MPHPPVSMQLVSRHRNHQSSGRPLLAFFFFLKRFRIRVSSIGRGLLFSIGGATTAIDIKSEAEGIKFTHP